MDFLEKLNYLMKENNLNKHSLSIDCNIPYTTIDNWYKRGYEGLKLTTLRKLANFFGTTLDFWVNNDSEDKDNKLQKYNYLINAYEAHPEVQHSVDLLLGLTQHQDKKITKLAPLNDVIGNDDTTVWAAARSNNGKEPGYRKLDKETLERLLNAEPDNDKIP